MMQVHKICVLRCDVSHTCCNFLLLLSAKDLSVHASLPTAQSSRSNQIFESCSHLGFTSPSRPIFESSGSSLPIVSADHYLNKILIAYCEETLSRRPTNRDSFRSSVENAIVFESS
jgi:hypothetical protein